jgi:rhodanese-related sulfurtransferase
MATVRYITAKELKAMSSHSDILICDVRELDEYHRENIIGAKNIPLSNFDMNEVNQLATKKQLVFHCLSGNRTRMNQSLFAQINAPEVFVLEGGINAWKAQDCAVAKNNKAPLPIMRQVFIIAGIFILLGVALTFLFSPWLLLINLFLGGALIFSGITGFCAMQKLLNHLPYNKKNHCNSGCQ